MSPRGLVAPLLLSALLAVAASGCEDATGGDPADASVVDRGRRPVPDGGDDGDTTAPDGIDGADLGTPDTGGGDGGSPDLVADLSSDPGVEDSPTTGEDIPGCADGDGDGFASVTCGGTDCNDSSRAINPDAAEICDFLDNDCRGGINQGLDCSFYAHSGDTLFRFDPFAGTVVNAGSVPGLLDMDTHPDGTLYGVSSNTLWRFDRGASEWVAIQSINIPGSTNGMAIDLDGRAYLTSGNVLTRIDLRTGVVTEVGTMGGSFVSSGDCVINKDNTLFMSSQGTTTSDVLVTIDGDTGTATSIGPIGYAEVYALTAAWGYLFGLTDAGEILIIDEATGEGDLIATVPDTRFYGAASTPER